MHTISGLRNSARLDAKSVMNSPCRFAGFTIANSTGAATNSHGGSSSMSIHWTWRNGCGEHLNAARRLQLLLFRLIHDREQSHGLVGVQPQTEWPGFAARPHGGLSLIQVAINLI
jgi:hypothetical protein